MIIALTLIFFSSDKLQIYSFFLWYFFSSLPEHEKNAGSEKDRILLEKEAELKRMQDVIAKMQAQIQQQTP